MLDMDVCRVDDVARVVLRGELDCAGAPRVERALETLLTDGVRDVIADIANTSFMDAAGLRAFVRAGHCAGACAARLLVCQPQPQPRRLLELAGDGAKGLEVV